MPRTTFSLIPDFQAKTYTIDGLEQLTRILKKYHVQEVQFTATRRVGLAGADRAELEQISRELQPVATPEKHGWITSMQSCPGKDACTYGMRNAEALSNRIETLELPVPLRAKITIGIAGCRRCCTEPYVRDIGLIAENRGWTLTFGGNGGGRARIGDVIAEGLTDDQAVELLRRCLTVYQEKAGHKMRTARFLEAYGTQGFLQAILTEPLTEPLTERDSE